jgi:hypothetical protein
MIKRTEGIMNIREASNWKLDLVLTNNKENDNAFLTDMGREQKIKTHL